MSYLLSVMHRKKIRRWHKLLSVSAVISFIVGSSLVSGANAQMNPPSTDGVYGPAYSTQDVITMYLDIDQNVHDFKSDDLTFRGTATGCVISTIPDVFAFSFGFQISGCSDGTVSYDLRKNAFFNADGVWGPTNQVNGYLTTIDRQLFSISINPNAVEESSEILTWEVLTNHQVKTIDQSKVILDGLGCVFSSSEIKTPTGFLVHVSNCQHGTTTTISLAPSAVTDYFGQSAPANGRTSFPYVVQQGVTALAPAPTPSPTATPTPTPTPTATLSDPTASLVTVNPPTDPPAPPTAQEQITPTEPVGPEPVHQPEPVLQPEPALQVELPILAPKIVRKVKPQQTPAAPVIEVLPQEESLPQAQPVPVEIVPFGR